MNGLNEQALMMGMEGMGMEETSLDEEAMGEAMALRDTESYAAPPPQDYQEHNPYAEGEHGSWLEGNLETLDGMAGGEFEEYDDGALELEIMNMDDEDEKGRDALVDEDIALSARSSEYQKKSSGEEEY